MATRKPDSPARVIMEEATSEIIENLRWEGCDDPTPKDINEGGYEQSCVDWADIVLSQLDDAEEFLLDTCPPHVAVKYRDRYYDSEAIDGVDDWRQLPFYHRH